MNGGLFSDENIEIPALNEKIFDLLLTKASEDFDWSEISPTIFGAVFESTLNPETRRKGGMHYTSIENIHKVIDPLFLNDLKAEFEEIKAIGIDRTRKQKLEAFQDKLASLTFLDPAAGSGNFLTETYLSLRRLENEVISELSGGQMFAEEESRSASENKLWQIRKQFEEGIPTWHNLFGYRMVNNQLQIVEEEAVVVRRIFADYLSGMGQQAIAKKLNGEKLLFNKKCWRTFDIYSILRNEKYAGNMLLQKTYVEDFRTKKQRKNRGERRQYYVEESHEPIITMEVYKRTQAELERRMEATEHKHKGSNYLFTGIIYCGMCGANYVRKNAPVGRRERIKVWICHTFDELGKANCPSQRIREDILIEKTCAILNLHDEQELTNEQIAQGIKRIEVPEHNILRYYLTDGRTETVRWENPSRSKSWTPEMRERARQKSLEQYRKRKEKEE